GVKRAIDMGSRVADGIACTSLVSLPPDSSTEIPVAKALVELTSAVAAGVPPTVRAGQADSAAGTAATTAISFDPFSYQRRASDTLAVAGIGDSGQEIKLGGEELIRVMVRQANFDNI